MPGVTEATYRSSAAVQMLHGGGSSWNSANRWFDKTLQVSGGGSRPSGCSAVSSVDEISRSDCQFIVGEDGMCGANYEHAPAEGPPIVALIDHVVEFT